MVPLSTIRDDLGISPEKTDINGMLERAIAQVTRLVRQRTNRWIHGAGIVNGGTGSLTVSCLEHNLQPGDKVKLLADTGSVSGNYVVQNVTRHTFTTTTGASGSVENLTCSVHPFRSTRLQGSGRQDLFLNGVLTPLVEIVKLQVDDEDVAYEIRNTDGDGRSVRLRKTDETVWATEWSRSGISPAFSIRRRSPEKSVYVEAYVGTRYIPSDVEMAVMSMVAEIAELEGQPKDVQTSSSEGVQRTRLSGEERRTQTLSPDRVLATWKA